MPNTIKPINVITPSAAIVDTTRSTLDFISLNRLIDGNARARSVMFLAPLLSALEAGFCVPTDDGTRTSLRVNELRLWIACGQNGDCRLVA
jgi:hypothetical protein